MQMSGGHLLAAIQLAATLYFPPKAEMQSIPVTGTNESRRIDTISRDFKLSMHSVTLNIPSMCGEILCFYYQQSNQLSCVRRLML